MNDQCVLDDAAFIQMNLAMLAKTQENIAKLN